MKNNRIVYIAILGLLTCASCNDEGLEISEDATVKEGLHVIRYGNAIQGKSSGTTIATFSDQQAYEMYVENLEIETENWDDAFIAQWNFLSDEALEAKEEALHFDSEKPLTDFENSIGLNSLRQVYLEAEEAWLNNNVLNDDTDPDTNPAFNFDANEMALLNNLAEVQIGNKIIKYLNSDEIEAINNGIKSGQIQTKSAQLVAAGASLIIENADYDSLIGFNGGDIDVIENDNVTIDNSDSAQSCSTGKRRTRTILLSPNRKIKVMIKVRAPFANWNGKIKAKLKSIRYNGKRWKKYRANISAGVVGRYYGSSCGGGGSLNKSKSKNRKKKVKYSFRDQYQHSGFYAESGAIKGVYSQNGVPAELVLSW